MFGLTNVDKHTRNNHPKQDVKQFSPQNLPSTPFQQILGVRRMIYRIPFQQTHSLLPLSDFYHHNLFLFYC